MMNEWRLKFEQISKNLCSNAHIDLDYVIKKGAALLPLYKKFNGLFAFDRALVIYPTISSPRSDFMSIQGWNALKIWKDYAVDELNEMLLFGQDIFGNQFCVREEQFYHFNVESGELKFLAETLDEFIMVLMQNYREITGCLLARDWQSNPNISLRLNIQYICVKMWIIYPLNSINRSKIRQTVNFKVNSPKPPFVQALGTARF